MTELGGHVKKSDAELSSNGSWRSRLALELMDAGSL